MTTTMIHRGARDLSSAHPDPQPSLARRDAWARDLALIGAASSLVIPILLGASLGFAAITAAAGMMLGALIGAAAPTLLGRRVRRVPIVLLLGAGAGLGANWGAASAALAALATRETSWVRAAELGATAGLVLLGMFWLPAVLLRARGRSTRPAVLATVAMCPGIAAYLALVW